jgi:5,6-dimethylbenzimidazole synthase
MTAPVFDTAFRDEFRMLLRWRRDVRRFRTDSVPPEMVAELFALADLAPSVGLSQPWRFVTVSDSDRRAAIRVNFERENAVALGELGGEKAAIYARLKLAGLDAAPVQFALFSDPNPQQGHGLGRRTMPETLAYSSVMALHTLWLAARAMGLGLGWVSILDPDAARGALDVPAAWDFIGYFCLGWPEIECETPELEREGWERRKVVEVVVR